MITSRMLPLLLLAAACAPLSGQEVRYIDLTVVQQRTELRHPPALPPTCEAANGPCASGGFGSLSVGDGGPDPRDPHTLGIYILRVSPTDIDPHEPFEVEFRLLNAGRVLIDLSVSPHLSDLQPDDPSLSFSYFSLALLTHIPVEPYVETRAVGLVQLYGSPDHEATMITLQPGEWIRVKATIRLSRWPSQPSEGRVYGGLLLRKHTFHPHAGGSSSEIQNLYPNITQMSPETWLPVHLNPPAAPADGKQ